MSIIFMLCIRQLKRYMRVRARLIGSLGQPLLFLLAMGFGLGPTFSKAGGGNYIQFISPGIIVMGILFTSVFSGIEIIWDRQFGFLKETLVAPVSRLQIVIGRTLGGAIVAFIQGIIVLCVCIAVGFRIQNLALFPIAIIVMLLSAVLFSAMGTAIGSVLEDMQAFPLLMNFMIMPLFFFSGALFPLAHLPSVMALIVRLNPVSYGVDALRGALDNVQLFGLSIDFIVLIILTMIVLSIASYLFSKIQL